MDHVRRRPAMYFGDVGVFGLHNAIMELVANSVDQFLQGLATTLEVEVDGLRVRVSDDGLGFPLEGPDGERYLTSLNRGSPTYDGHAPHIHLTLVGLGLAPVCAVSEQFEVSAWRAGKRYTQRFARGKAVAPARLLEEGDGRGSDFELVLDREIFSDAVPNLAQLRQTLLEAAYLFSGITITLNGERFHTDFGLSDLALRLGDERPALSTEGPAEPFHFLTELDDVRIEAAALGWAAETEALGWANGRPCEGLGTHWRGFRRALEEVAWIPALALIHVIFKDPEFAGPQRHILSNRAVERVVYEALRPALSAHVQGLQAFG